MKLFLHEALGCFPRPLRGLAGRGHMGGPISFLELPNPTKSGTCEGRGLNRPFGPAIYLFFKQKAAAGPGVGDVSAKPRPKWGQKACPRVLGRVTL